MYRVGDGAAALGSAATAVFFDEYTPAGSLVQSIQMPTATIGVQRRFTASGTATSEGELARSVDGQYLTAAGYDAALGTASITTSTAATVNRVIARLDGAGVVDTRTALTDAISGGNPRGVVSTNGTDLWISGTSSGGGIRYAAFGATTSTALNTATVTNLRHTGIFGGQLFVSSQSGAFRLASVGTGTPTTGGQPIVNLPGLPTATTSPYGFFFADLSAAVPGLDTVYVADDTTTTGGTGGIQKYSLVGGTWTANGSIASTAGLRGLTGSVSGGAVTLYATSGSTLFTTTDSGGYAAPIAGSLTTVASAGTNKAFRGVAFAPGGTTPTPTPTPTNPAGSGAANPNPVTSGGSTLLTVTVTPGTNEPSTNLVVTAALPAALGGGTVQLFDSGTNGDVTAGDSVFSASLTVTAPASTYAIPFTITDAQSRSGTGSISLTVQTAAAPPQVAISQVYGGGGNAGATFKNDFIELFNRGTSAVSVTGWSVQYLSATGTGSWAVTTLSGTLAPGQYYLVQEAPGAGGSAALPLPDAIGTIGVSATAGKVALVSNNTALSGCPSAGGGIVDLVGFGSAANCVEGGGPAAAPSNTTSVRRRGGTDGCTDTDNNNADFYTGAAFPRNSGVLGSCVVPPALPLAIHDIQGTGHTSLYTGQLVTTTGVVTARRNNGFFLQAPDAEADTDPSTSEGVFVFTTNAPIASAAVGNYVGVTGTVQEFIPSADPNSPSVTEIAGSPAVTLFTAAVGLPSPAVLTVADLSASDIDNLEKFEGMRVSVPSLTVVAPTQGTVNEATATATSTGVFYGVITGVAWPMREPGIQLPDPLPAGSPANVPRYDANPERLRVDSDALGGAAVDVTTDAIVTGVVGPLDYSFRSYTVLQEAAAPLAISGNIAAIPVPSAGTRELTVASFNMERFFDTDDDPRVQDVVLTAAAFERRLAKASLAIRQSLRLPDVIGVEEMENLSTLQRVADRVNADAASGPGTPPHYEALLLEGNDIGGIDVGFLVNTNRVTLAGSAEQIGRDATYVTPTGAPALLNDRPSLLVRATVDLPGTAPFPITIIVNHLRSLSGVDDPVDGNRVRAKRRAQAEYLANYVQALQSANPAERIVLVGDFNAFAFSDGYVDVMGTIIGTPAPADQVVLASPRLVSPNLIDLVETVPAEQRYSFVFGGVAQELDHALVTQNLLPFVSRFEYARNNADFPDVYRNDATRPERISDHDMIVAYFEVPLAATLAYTGPSSATIGQPLALSADVVGPGSGVVQFALGAATAAGPIAGGSATAIVDSVDGPRGVRTLNLTFAGGGGYAGASATAPIVVSEATAIAIAPYSAVAGIPVTIAATLRAGATPLAGEAMAFSVGSQTFPAMTGAGGDASVTVTLPAAAVYPVDVAYAGNGADYRLGSSASTTLDVARASTTVTYTGATAVNNGQSLAVSASVTSQTGVVLPPQPLTFTLSNGQAVGGSGSAAIDGVLATPGPQTLTVRFAGDDTYTPASTDVTIAVSQATTLVIQGSAGFAGAPIRAVATLASAPQGGPLAGQPVAFVIDGQQVSAVTDVNGTADVVVIVNHAGSIPVSATFAGDAAQSLLSSTATGALTLSRMPTTVAYTGVTSIPNGDSLDAAATVTTQAGVVLAPQPLTFTLGNDQSASGVGAATIAGVAATPGPVQLTVAFAGDAQYEAASTVALITVRQATGVTYSGPAGGEAGAPIALTAVLRRSPSGGVISGEPVLFAAGPATATGITNAAGVATGSVTLGIGAFPVSVVFAGDPSRQLLASSSSGSLVIRDTRPPVISAVTPSVTSIWPPNKEMVPVSLAVTDADTVDPAPACRVTTVTNSEGAGDFAITGPLSVSLRADRDGKGHGRVYTISVTCTDASGNAATATAAVSVPHDQGK